jgi:acetyl-CoA synthetase
VELKKWIVRQLGKPLKPQAIHYVDERPRTRNSKILRRVIQAAYLGKGMWDLSSMENPQSVEDIRVLHGQRAARRPVAKDL